jgi:hypothetical protein
MRRMHASAHEHPRRRVKTLFSQQSWPAGFSSVLQPAAIARNPGSIHPIGRTQLGDGI